MNHFDAKSYEFSRQNCLITRQGAFDLKSGKKRHFKPQFKFPDLYSAFQMSHKLYICGGVITSGEEQVLVNDFFTCDSRGRCEPLQPMSTRRNAVSLTGLQRKFITALGGWDSVSISTAEQYFFYLNEWKALPELNIARQWAGSCITN